MIGFAAETDDVVQNAVAKRARKGADWIIANDVSGDVMGGDRNRVHLISDSRRGRLAGNDQGRSGRAAGGPHRRAAQGARHESRDQETAACGRICRCPITPRRARRGWICWRRSTSEIELAARRAHGGALGIAIELPLGVEAQVRPRSGLALNHGITCLNAPGTIDSDYRGEIKAILINHGDAPFQIARGVKIAQMVIARHEQAELVESDSLVRQRPRRRRLRLDRHDGEDAMMLSLSRKTLLALEAVIDIAFNARPEPVQAKEITARQGVPQRYLEQVMQQLVRAGILKGVRGPRGGYRLARERRRISVGDVVRVAESIEDDEEEKIRPRSELGLRIVAPLVQTLQDEVMARLDSVSIEDLCQRARVQGVDVTGGDSADFTI